MALYFIGLGLWDEKDISIKGLEKIKECNSIYLENYTSKLNCEIEDLEKLYGKKIILADRELVEKQAEETILKDAKENKTAFLVIGDVFSATTHMDLFLRAKKLNIETEIIHNSSVLTAVGTVGLELYKYGKTTSIPFDNKDIKTPLEVLEQNQKNNLHTLILLDLDPKNNKYMTIKQALEYLNIDQLCIGCAGLGSKNPEIKVKNSKELIKEEFTKFPQCLIIPAKLHFIEEEALDLWRKK